MTKKDLAEKIAAEFDMSKAEAGRVVDYFIDSITATLKRGDDVALAGFGKFEVRHRNAREARNPRTGETIQVPARKVPAFKAAKALKDVVNN